MDRKVIDNMLKDAPVAKTPRTMTCGCGVVVKVGKYQGKEPYKCHACRYPKTQK